MRLDAYLGTAVKRIQKAMAWLATVGVVAWAMAAHIQVDFRRLPADRGSMSTHAMAPAPAVVGRRLQGSQPLVATADLLLAGDVVDINAATGPLSVVAYVGERAFPATVQGTAYSVLIPGGVGTGMIRVEAHAGSIYFVSVLGAHLRQLALAGPDRRLDISEQSALRISPYSTSLYWLTRYALGDRQATTDAEFERAMRATNGHEIEVASSLLWLTANHPQELEGRYANGLAKLGDRAYFQGYMEGSRDPLHIAKGFLGWQQTYAPVRSLDELPAQSLLLSALKMDGMPQSVDSLRYIERVSANLFSITENTALTGRRYTASVDANGDIQLAPTSEIRGLITDPETGTGYVRTYLHYSLRRLYRGAQYSQWYLVLSWEDRSGGGSSSSFPTRSGQDETVLTGLNVEAWMHTQDFAALEPGTRALPWACMGAGELNLRVCEYAQHRRRADGTGELVDQGSKVDAQLQPLPTRRVGAAFRWSIDTSGGLVLTTADVATSFWRVDSAEAGVGPVLYRSRSLRPGSEGLVMMGLGFTIPQRQASEILTAAEGNWVGGYYGSVPSLYSEDMGYAEHQRNADGTVQRRSVYEGTQWPWRTWSWQNVDGALFDRVDYAPAPATSCAGAIAAGTESSCMARLIYFKPLRRIGNRYYGVEETYEQLIMAGWAQAPQLWSSRSVSFDCRQGPCQGSTGLAVNAAPALRPPGTAPWGARRAGLRPRQAFVQRTR